MVSASSILFVQSLFHYDLDIPATNQSETALPKPLRNLLTLRCSFSWMESRYSCTLTSNSPEEGEKQSWITRFLASQQLNLFPLTAALYLSEPACAPPSPGWTSQTSGSPWRPPGSGAQSWMGSLYENPRAGRSRGPGMRKRRSSHLPVLRWWRVDSGPPAPRRNERRPRIQRCWDGSSLKGRG